MKMRLAETLQWLIKAALLLCCFKVFHWTHEMPPDQKRPLDTYYDSDRGRLASYQLEVSQSNFSFKQGGGCCRKTAFSISVFYARNDFWKWPRVLRYRPSCMSCIKQFVFVVVVFFLSCAFLTIVLLRQVPDSLSVHDLNLSTGLLPVIQTADIKRGLDMFSPWLHPDHKKPFLLVGPEGCGKE